MSWRIVSVSSMSKLDYKMDYLVVRSREDTTRIHLSEVSVLILESTAMSLTAYLLRELERRKIDVIFCDETRTPYGMLSSLYGSEVVVVAEPHGDRLKRLIVEINQLASELCLELDFDAVYTEIERPEELVRMMGFRAAGGDLPFTERLLTWMRLQRRFMGKQLFVFYGLSSFLEEDERRSFYRSVFYEKLRLLLIEPRQDRPPLPEEETTIVDKDLCIIR